MHKPKKEDIRFFLLSSLVIKVTNFFIIRKVLNKNPRISPGSLWVGFRANRPNHAIDRAKLKSSGAKNKTILIVGEIWSN
jgi:hypothetical protein